MYIYIYEASTYIHEAYIYVHIKKYYIYIYILVNVTAVHENKKSLDVKQKQLNYEQDWRQRLITLFTALMTE